MLDKGRDWNEYWFEKNLTYAVVGNELHYTNKNGGTSSLDISLLTDTNLCLEKWSERKNLKKVNGIPNVGPTNEIPFFQDFGRGVVSNAYRVIDGRRYEFEYN